MNLVVQNGSAIMAHMPPAQATADGAPEHRRLAEAVKARRLAVGLSIRAAATQAGIARGTWIALEEASRRTANTAYAAIEQTLGWTPGSIAAVLGGGEPTEDRKPAAPPKGPADEALIRVMSDPRISDRDKMRIARILIDERERFERERVARAEDLIRAFRDENP